MFDIYLDMDEVLSDLQTGVCRLFGLTHKQQMEVEDRKEWAIVDRLCDVAGITRMTEEAFWGIVAKEGTRFWAELPMLSWMWELINVVDQYSKFPSSWNVITTPTMCPLSYAGKAQWLQGHFGKHFKRLYLCHDKPALARPNRVLIDDREDTVKNWIKAGGIGILFPRRHNANRVFCNMEVGYVKMTLSDIVAGAPG